MITDIRNKPGVVRIDDVQANALLSRQEQERRKAALDNAMRALGTGLYDMIHAPPREAQELDSSGADDDDEEDREWTYSPEEPAPPASTQKSRRGVARLEPGQRTTCILRALPEGYALFQARRPATGIKTADAYDPYIYGSGIVEEFNSYASFVPHLYWIYLEMPDDRPCTCSYCVMLVEKKGKGARHSYRAQSSRDRGASGSSQTQLAVALERLGTSDTTPRLVYLQLRTVIGFDRSGIPSCTL